MKSLRMFAAVVMCTALLLPTGCKDDEPTGPSKRPVLSNLWPNEDGRSWSFDAIGSTWGDPGTPENLSPTPVTLPSLADLVLLADAREFPEGATVSSGTYRLEFSDSITTDSGVRRQNLVETLTFEATRMPALASRPGSAFLQQLAIARPDLRGRIAAQYGGEPFVAGDFLSLILHGGAWEKTSDWIGTYGDIDQRLAWKFLEGDLTTGHEFAYQLVPMLADDVLLRARVLGPGTIETPAGRYTNAIEVFYVIDYGSSEATDESGNSLGYLHSVGYGSVHYVPGVGPVASYERILSSYGPKGLGAGYGELQYALRSSGLTS